MSVARPFLGSRRGDRVRVAAFTVVDRLHGEGVLLGQLGDVGLREAHVFDAVVVFFGGPARPARAFPSSILKTRTGVAYANLSQNGHRTRWKRAAHRHMLHWR
jgi:hypothetical protein